MFSDRRKGEGEGEGGREGGGGRGRGEGEGKGEGGGGGRKGKGGRGEGGKGEGEGNQRSLPFCLMHLCLNPFLRSNICTLTKTFFRQAWSPQYKLLSTVESSFI